MAKILMMVEDLEVEAEDLEVEVGVIATAGTLISQSVIGMMKLRSARRKRIMYPIVPSW